MKVDVVYSQIPASFVRVHVDPMHIDNTCIAQLSMYFLVYLYSAQWLTKQMRIDTILNIHGDMIDTDCMDGSSL